MVSQNATVHHHRMTWWVADFSLRSPFSAAAIPPKPVDKYAPKQEQRYAFGTPPTSNLMERLAVLLLVTMRLVLSCGAKPNLVTKLGSNARVDFTSPSNQYDRNLPCEPGAHKSGTAIQGHVADPSLVDRCLALAAGLHGAALGCCDGCHFRVPVCRWFPNRTPPRKLTKRVTTWLGQEGPG